jgi:hypothetical protein
MTKIQSKLLILIATVIIVAIAYPFLVSERAQAPESTEEKVAYFLLANENDTLAQPFDGCGVEYLARFDSITSGGLQDSLQELFSIKDPELSALANSDIEVAISNSTINLQGELISAGTCDDPRIRNQIIKTIEIYYPEQEYTILLNGSESEWRCWNDQSGLCN